MQQLDQSDIFNNSAEYAQTSLENHEFKKTEYILSSHFKKSNPCENKTRKLQNISNKGLDFLFPY